MKTKRIVALALTAAMAISMASMTAFASSLSGKKWINYKTTGEVEVTNDASYRETYEGFIVEYKVQNKDGSQSKLKRYVYRKGSTIEEKTTNGKTEKAYKLNAPDDTQTGEEDAGVLWKNFKSVAEGLGTPSLEEEDNCVFVGWTLNEAKAGTVVDYKTDTKAANGWQDSDYNADKDDVLKDGSDIIDIVNNVTSVTGHVNTNGTGEANSPIIIYPVFREKTAAEKLASQVAIANRAKVAKPVGGKEWVYSQKDLDRSTAYVSSPLAEDVSGDALKKCNAEMKHSRVYEIKPAFVKEDGTKEIVELKKGATETVVIPIKTLYANDDNSNDANKILGNKDKVNDYIKKGKIKVYHIGSDGKSRQVTGIKSTDDGNAVTFKSGFYSEFVITKDPNARAQAGEEDGASGGNPATGEASTLPVAMLALAALSATGVVAYKKRKAE